MSKDGSSTPDGVAIKVGDLVQVVRGHSCLMERVGGYTFTVTGLVQAIGGGWTCSICGERDIARHDAYGAAGCPRPPTRIHLPYAHLTKGKANIPLSSLKRIPPLEELEGERTQEDIREPA